MDMCTLEGFQATDCSLDLRTELFMVTDQDSVFIAWQERGRGASGLGLDRLDQEKQTEYAQVKLVTISRLYQV